MRLLVSATERELKPILDRSSGMLTACGVPVRITGVGKVNAAVSLALRLASEPGIREVINLGVCGAYDRPGVAPGHLVVTTETCYGDEGIETDDGFVSIGDAGFPLMQDIPGVTEEILRLPHGKEVGDLLSGRMDVQIHTGRMITVSACAGTARLATLRQEKWEPVGETMEGCALAHVCIKAGIRYTEIRGVSNMVGPYDRSAWKLDEAVDNVCSAVEIYLKETRCP